MANTPQPKPAPAPPPPAPRSGPPPNTGGICKALGSLTGSKKAEGVCRNLTGSSRQVTETRETVCITEHGWGGGKETRCYKKTEE